MPIQLAPAAQEAAIASLQRYFRENAEEPLSHLGARALLDYLLAEIGPTLYNQAVAEVQARMQQLVLDLDIDLHAEEFPYWTQPRGRRGKKA